MYCLNCKKIIPDGLETCPECGKSLKPERCPECWNKLEDTKSTCTKCGCDIDRYIKEKEEEQSTVEKTIWDRIKELPLWINLHNGLHNIGYKAVTTMLRYRRPTVPSTRKSPKLFASLEKMLSKTAAPSSCT